MTINLNHGYGNLQVVDMSKGVGRGDDDDNDDKIDDNGDGHIDLEGALRIIQRIYQVNWSNGILCKVR